MAVRGSRGGHRGQQGGQTERGRRRGMAKLGGVRKRGRTGATMLHEMLTVVGSR